VNPFHHEKRGSMTEKRAIEVFARFDGHCAHCKRKLFPGEDYEIDHIIALANGGTDEDSNLQLLCEGCHIIKTGGDVSDAAKGKRRYRKQFGLRKFKPSKWR